MNMLALAMGAIGALAYNAFKKEDYSKLDDKELADKVLDAAQKQQLSFEGILRSFAKLVDQVRDLEDDQSQLEALREEIRRRNETPPKGLNINLRAEDGGYVAHAGGHSFRGKTPFGALRTLTKRVQSSEGEYYDLMRKQLKVDDAQR